VAARHGLSAWVADELAEAGRPAPPSLTQAARSQAGQGAKLRRLTHLVLDTFARVGVTPVLLKGYGLASRLFPANPLARPSSDVDVLVLPEELALVEPALAKLGLRHTEVPGVHDAFEEHHHRAWSGSAGLVEVHFRLFSGFGGGQFDERGLLARTRRGELDGRAVRWLAPEDEFLYLATHAANHGFLRLSWLVDLARYLEWAPDLDWGLMHARALEARFVAPVAASLGLLEDLLGVTLPPASRAAFPRGPVRLRLDRELFSADRVAEASLSNDRLGSFLLRLYLVDSPGQAARHLLEGAQRAWRQRRGS
jgi:hypothetical protein